MTDAYGATALIHGTLALSNCARSPAARRQVCIFRACHACVFSWAVVLLWEWG